jgi:hypothetical protein
MDTAQARTLMGYCNEIGSNFDCLISRQNITRCPGPCYQCSSSLAEINYCDFVSIEELQSLSIISITIMA